MTTRQKLAAAFLAFLVLSGLALRFAPIARGPAGPIEACVVEDTLHRTQAAAAVLASPLVREAGKARGIAWHAVDARDSGPDIAEVQWAIEAARGHTMPTLCLRKGTGTPTVVPLPATPQACAELLKGIR